MSRLTQLGFAFGCGALVGGFLLLFDGVLDGSVRELLTGSFVLFVGLLAGMAAYRAS